MTHYETAVFISESGSELRERSGRRPALTSHCIQPPPARPVPRGSPPTPKKPPRTKPAAPLFCVLREERACHWGWGRGPRREVSPAIPRTLVLCGEENYNNRKTGTRRPMAKGAGQSLAARDQGEGRHNMCKILVIDDDRELCELIRKSVQSEKIEADLCEPNQ